MSKNANGKSGWTKEEEDYIRNNYLTMSYREIGLVLNKEAKSPKAQAIAVSVKAHRMGLCKPTEGNRGSFQKNNKIALIPDGTVRDFGNQQKIKVDGKWVLHQIYLWNDDIPSGYKVSFIDGNSLNCVCTNLKLVATNEKRKVFIAKKILTEKPIIIEPEPEIELTLPTAIIEAEPEPQKISKKKQKIEDVFDDEDDYVEPKRTPLLKEQLTVRPTVKSLKDICAEMYAIGKKRILLEDGKTSIFVNADDCRIPKLPESKPIIIGAEDDEEQYFGNSEYVTVDGEERDNYEY